MEGAERSNWSLDGVAPAEKNRTSALAVEFRPPMTTTLPSDRSVAECGERLRDAMLEYRHEPVGVGTVGGVWMAMVSPFGAPVPVPPTTTTRPSGRSVAVCCERVESPEPTSIEVPPMGSYSSAVLPA